MKHLKIIILSIATSMLLCACPDNEEEHRYIKLINKSGVDIGCQMLWMGKITKADTIFQCDMVTDYIIPIDSRHIFECGIRSSGWEDDFKTIPYIQFLIMDGFLFEQYFSMPCDSVRKYVPVLHCYQLKLDDLERMNWTVVYPPEE